MNVDLFGPASCLADGNCACENIPVGFGIYQPVSILTAIVLILVGIWGFYRFNKVHYKTALGYSIALTLTGISAIYLHLKMDYIGQVLDFSFVTISLILLELIYFFKKDSIWVSILLALLVIILNIFFPELRSIFAGVSIIGYLFLNIVVRKNWNRIKWLLLSFLLGGILWYGDGNFLCYPTSIFQPHGIWHIIVAVLCYYNLEYYFKYVFPKRF